MRNFFFLLFFVFLILGCKKQEEQKNIIQPIEDYTGLKIGNTLYYNVMYVFHDDQVDRHDTLQFKMKSIIEDTFRDNENNLRFKIHRFRWNDSIASWVNYKVLSGYKSSDFYFETEDNIQVKKMYLPYIYNFEWNSNSYNVNDTIHFRYKDRINLFKINKIQIDSVIHVKQQLYQTYVDLKRKSEYYAKNKGLVYKVYKDLKIKKGDTLKVDRGEEWYLSLYQFVKVNK